MRLVAILCFVLVALAGCRRDERPSPSPARPPAVTTAAAPPPRPMMAPAPAGTEVAVLAGGCFWGMEDLLRDIPGVLDTEVGYAGGGSASPTYAQVSSGDTGHAESVRVVFDPTKLTYATLLERWYFRMHDPTTPGRQGNDVGSKYRSAIFYASEAQRLTALEVIRKVDASGVWKAKLVTEVVAAGAFTAAEADHQDYLDRNPDGYTCHYLRD